MVIGLVLATLACPAAVLADNLVPPILQDVGFADQRGVQVPRELVFRDEQGHSVRLGDYLGRRPVVLTLNDYQCPNLCSMMLDSLRGSLADLTLTPGLDYEAVTVSVNPQDTPAIAAYTKSRYASSAATGVGSRTTLAEHWHFLTGDQASIAALARAVGFNYAYDAVQREYAHPTGVIVLTGDGRVSRYLYGLDFPTRDLRLAVVEASQGQVGSPVDQLLLTCYHYDASIGRYTNQALEWIRLGSAAAALALAGFLGSLWYRDLRRTVARSVDRG